jgi:hypothetical protein
VRIAPSPLGVSAVPVAASVMSAYWRSVLRKAITGSEISCFLKLIKASMAEFGNVPPLYPESFRVSLNRGAAITVKYLMCVRKKLHRPMKDRIVLTSLGALAVWIALSLFFSGLIPSGVKVKPRYETSLLPKMHLSRLILR